MATLVRKMWLVYMCTFIYELQGELLVCGKHSYLCDFGNLSPLDFPLFRLHFFKNSHQKLIIKLREIKTLQDPHFMYFSNIAHNLVVDIV